MSGGDVDGDPGVDGAYHYDFCDTPCGVFQICDFEKRFCLVHDHPAEDQCQYGYCSENQCKKEGY